MTTGVRQDGRGQPTVLLCSGMADGVAAWEPLVSRLADQHSVVRFFRPGFGGVPGERVPPDLAGLVGRLDALTGSYASGRAVLVAHSAAALPAEAYARLWPDRLAGLVLVDPSVVGERPGSGRLAACVARWVAFRGPVLSRLLDRSGVLRPVGPWVWARVVRRMCRTTPDAGWQAEAARTWSSGSALVAGLVEWLVFPALAHGLAALRRRTAPPEAPVVVLTALGDLRSTRARTAWRTAHARLAASFPAGRQVVYDEERHFLQVDVPDAVAAAVRSVG